MKPFALDFCAQNIGIIISIHVPCTTMHWESYILIEKENHLFSSTPSTLDEMIERSFTRIGVKLSIVHRIIWPTRYCFLFSLYLLDPRYNMHESVMIRVHGSLMEGIIEKCIRNDKFDGCFNRNFLNIRTKKCQSLICEFVFSGRLYKYTLQWIMQPAKRWQNIQIPISCSSTVSFSLRAIFG